MKWYVILLFGLLFLTSRCGRRNESQKVEKPKANLSKALPAISREAYHDKVLGLLIGSAIGDAMGAPTEMWRRRDIQLDYGFVDGLDSMVRSPTAEGIWKYNLPAGGTTDDTRWKKLIVEFLLENGLDSPKPTSFAQYIVDLYRKRIEALKETSGFEPEPFEENLMKMSWLQEWALVAKPYSEDNMHEYANALSRFYGGEMTCAGMLYSTIFGAVYPMQPELAYDLGYNFGIFDIGYARDMTALVSAMVAASFDEKATPEKVLNVNRSIDPQGYFKSRLVGRSAYRFYQYAKNTVYETDAMQLDELNEIVDIPKSMRHMDTLEYIQLKKAFDLLDQVNQDVAFHPGEIYLITMTAMMFCDFDFERSMSFIVNYGRDNDTVAAIAGAILGAYWGANKLPQHMADQVVAVNKQELGIDIKDLAVQLTDKFFN